MLEPEAGPGNRTERMEPMKFAPKQVLAALALAGLGAVAVAQPAPAASGLGGPGAGGHGMMMRHHDPAKMEQRRTEHLARLKQKLQLSPGQEQAWTTFTAAMPKPPARPDRAEMDKLSTPERLDRMKAMRDARTADMDRMSTATKAFYAQLTPEQKKVFDQEAIPRRHGGHHGH